MAGAASALRYAVSEGPTKVDFGEDDNNVLPREAVTAGEWSNPLAKTDDGLDDETVLTMLDGQVRVFNDDGIEDETVLTMLDSQFKWKPVEKVNGLDAYEQALESGEPPDRPKVALSKIYIEGEGDRFPVDFWTSSWGYASPDIQTNMPWVPVAKWDADGDGVEDNEKLTPEEIDSFYIPNVFNTAEEVYNTHNGELPGHRQLVNYHEKPEWIDPWEGDNSGSLHVNEITDQGMNSDLWMASQYNLE